MTRGKRGLAVIPVVVWLVAAAPPASAEWFSDLYLGAALTESADLRITAPAVAPGLTIVFQDVEFEPSVAYGGRGGYWFDGAPFLGLALDVSHFEPDIDAQVVTATVIGSDTLAHIDASVTVLALDLMLRWGSSRPPTAPTAVSSRTSRSDRPSSSAGSATPLDPPGQSDSDTSVGVKVGAGLAWQVHANVAVFAEYRLTHFSPRLRGSDRGAAERIDTDINTHHLLGGLSFRF